MGNYTTIYNYLRDQGFSSNAAYGVLGNIKAESGGSTSAIGDGGTSGGICQWHNERWTALKNFASQRGKPWTDLGVQLDFMMHELRAGYPNLLNMLQTTNNMEQATRAWMVQFERPADTSEAAIQGRVDYADTFRDSGTGGGGDDGGGGGGGDAGRDGGGDRGPSRSDYGFDPQFLETHPEIRQLVNDAVESEMSITKFQAKLKETKWWLNHTAAQRDWQMTLAEDPASAAETVKQYTQQIRSLATSLGVDLNDRQIKDLAEKAARNTWDTTEMQMYVGGKFRLGKGAQTGQAATATYDLESMADDFAVPMSRKQKAKWTTNILQGEMDVNGYADVLREKAKNLYPHLGDAIDRAGSVRAWADAYLQQAANMLGQDPDTMRLDRGKYAQLLAPTKEGKPVSMDQWERMLREDEKFGWDKTNGAQEEASGLATQLGQKMGAL